MWVTTARRAINGNWTFQSGDVSQFDPREGMTITFAMGTRDKRPNEQDVVLQLSEALKISPIDWIAAQGRRWVFDLDTLKENFSFLQGTQWCKGKISIVPEFDLEEQIVDRPPWYDGYKLAYEPKLRFTLPQDLKGRSTPMIQIDPPIEINESLVRFGHDYPDPSKVAFIMIKYAKTEAHDSIINTIRDVLRKHGIVGVLAKDKQYHDNLKENILTYLHGCGFGIAVFERIESNDFNPNICSLSKSLCAI